LRFCSIFLIFLILHITGHDNWQKIFSIILATIMAFFGVQDLLFSILNSWSNCLEISLWLMEHWFYCYRFWSILDLTDNPYIWWLDELKKVPQLNYYELVCLTLFTLYFLPIVDLLECIPKGYQECKLLPTNYNHSLQSIIFELKCLLI
jgi:hypothetical protein